MPKQYIAMRNQFAKKMDYDKAQSKAAAIYNSKHPDAPVTGKSEPESPREQKRKRQAKKMKKEKC